MKNEKKNLRRIFIVVTAQTKGNLERLAAVCGYSEIGRVVDKLTREKMISLHDFERKEKYHAIDGKPTADTVSVVYGRWVNADDGLMCSACSKYVDDKIYIDYAGYIAEDFPLTFCPNCGARMEASESESR